MFEGPGRLLHWLMECFDGRLCTEFYLDIEPSICRMAPIFGVFSDSRLLEDQTNRHKGKSSRQLPALFKQIFLFPMASPAQFVLRCHIKSSHERKSFIF
jgi:hypothetical protein